MSNETSATPSTVAPKIPVEEHRGLKRGSKVTGAVIRKVEVKPRRDNPSVLEALFALVQFNPEDGDKKPLVWKLDRIDCPAGTHSARQKWLSEATVGMPLGELVVEDIWTKNGQVQGRLSARKPREELIISTVNATDPATGERVRTFVDCEVADTSETGIRLTALEGPMKDWDLFVHKSNVPGGDSTINKLQSGEHVLTVEVIVARVPDRSRKNEENRFDIVLQGSFQQVEDKKRADAELLETFVGNRKGKLTGTVVGATQTAFIVELNTEAKTKVEIEATNRFFPKIGDEVPLQGIIEGGELKVVPGKGR